MSPEEQNILDKRKNPLWDKLTDKELSKTTSSMLNTMEKTENKVMATLGAKDYANKSPLEKAKEALNKSDHLFQEVSAESKQAKTTSENTAKGEIKPGF